MENPRVMEWKDGAYLHTPRQKSREVARFPFHSRTVLLPR